MDRHTVCVHAFCVCMYGVCCVCLYVCVVHVQFDSQHGRVSAIAWSCPAGVLRCISTQSFDLLAYELWIHFYCAKAFWWSNWLLVFCSCANFDCAYWWRWWIPLTVELFFWIYYNIQYTDVLWWLVAWVCVQWWNLLWCAATSVGIYKLLAEASFCPPVYYIGCQHHAEIV